MQAEKKIYIIGSGTIGKALAVALATHGKAVTLIRARAPEAVESSQQIDMQTADGSLLTATVQVAGLASFAELDGLVVLANKSYGNAALAAALRGKTGRSPVVILQNGLGVEDVFIQQHFPEVFRCVLFVTSQIASDGVVHFKPVAECPVGLVKGSENLLASVVGLLNSPPFCFIAEKDIRRVAWKKSIINCVFNSVCPLLDTDNGIFFRNGDAAAIAERVIDECLNVAKAQHVFLDRAEVMETLLRISRLSDGQFISTLQDIRNRRETEIDTLNFEIVRLAAKSNGTGAVSETRLLGELTRLKSELARF